MVVRGKGGPIRISAKALKKVTSNSITSTKPKKDSISYHLTELAKTIPAGAEQSRSLLLAQKLWEHALEGREWAISHVLNRIEGRVRDIDMFASQTTKLEECSIEDLKAKAATLAQALSGSRPGQIGIR